MWDWGSLREVVLNFEFRQNRFSYFGVVVVEFRPFPLLWPVAHNIGYNSYRARRGKF